MMHKIKWSSVLSALSAIFLAGNIAHADDAWLKASGLGPYADTKQDWSAIEKAARAEGKVVIYSVSSRFSKLVGIQKRNMVLILKAMTYPQTFN